MKRSIAICGICNVDSYIEEYICRRLSDYQLLLGDNSLRVDKLIQDVLIKHNKRDVEVYFCEYLDYCADKTWHLCRVENFSKDFMQYATMISDATFLLALWDKSDLLTKQCIQLALQQGKCVLLYCFDAEIRKVTSMDALTLLC